MTLVTAGVPVRNGAQSLAVALESLRRQTHQELEVVISDNASDDATAEICSEFAARDPRFRVIRHSSPVPALTNFRTVFEAARGDYFLWAAHDDWRSENYVSTLLAAHAAHPAASVACSEVVLFDEQDVGPEAGSNLMAFNFDASTLDLELPLRLKKTTQTAPFHIYGLLRSAALRHYPWPQTEYAPDWPIMLWLATRGEFVQVPGAYFLYYWPARPKTEAEKATANAFRPLGRFARERIAWVCASVVAQAAGIDGRKPSRLELFRQIYVWQHRGFKNLLYTRAPGWAQAAWRLTKKLRATPSPGGRHGH